MSDTPVESYESRLRREVRSTVLLANDGFGSKLIDPDDDELSRLRERVRELEAERAEAATLINCAGPITHRIQILLNERASALNENARAMKVLEAARQLATGASLFVFTADYEAAFDALDKAFAAFDAAFPSEPVVSQQQPDVEDDSLFFTHLREVARVVSQEEPK